MAVKYGFIEIGSPLGGEPMQTEVVEDEQIGRHEGPDGMVHRVGDPSHGLEEVVGVDEAHGASGADDRVA